MKSELIANVLLVEDNEVSREMLTRRLERRGYSVCCAVDGSSAVAMAANKLPSVILMDIALGEMDGWEATTRIKADSATSHIPIIALTAHSLESDRQKSIEVGCSDFDTKPVDIERLLGKIAKALRTIQVTSAECATNERRSAARRRLLKPGTIAFGTGGVSCLVRNLSQTGANLEVSNPIGIPELCALVIEADGFKRDCVIVWRKQTRIGVKFVRQSSGK